MEEKRAGRRSGLLEVDVEVLDDRVRKKVAADFLKLRLGLGEVGSGDLELDDAADADGVDAFHAEVVDRLADGFALGVEDRLFRGHDDSGFEHKKPLIKGAFLGKARPSHRKISNVQNRS